jgi:hypothetical protein
MWSPWRRSFSAFSCWLHTRCVIVDAHTPEDLLHLMLSAEMSAVSGQIL